MKNLTNVRWPFGILPHAASLGLLALTAAMLITAALFRPAQSQQAPPDPGSDALPRLNLLGRHKSEAAEYATQIKARYPPSSAEYAEARRRYEECAEKFAALVDSLSASVRGNPGGRSTAALREQSRLAVEAGDSFADWAEGLLQLLRRGRGAAGAPPKAAAAAEAAAGLAGAFGPKDERAKGRAVELTNELVRFRPWDEIPPFTPSGGGASPTPSPTPSPSPSLSGR